MKKLIVICITAIICISIVAFPYYYKTFVSKEPLQTSNSAPSAEESLVYQGSRYTSLGELGDTANRLIVDQKTGKIYCLKVSRLSSSINSEFVFDLVYAAKID